MFHRVFITERVRIKSRRVQRTQQRLQRLAGRIRAPRARPRERRARPGARRGVGHCAACQDPARHHKLERVLHAGCQLEDPPKICRSPQTLRRNFRNTYEHKKNILVWFVPASSHKRQQIECPRNFDTDAVRQGGTADRAAPAHQLRGPCQAGSFGVAEELTGCAQGRLAGSQEEARRQQRRPTRAPPRRPTRAPPKRPSISPSRCSWTRALRSRPTNA